MRYPVHPARTFRDQESGLEVLTTSRGRLTAYAEDLSSGLHASKPVLLAVDDEAQVLREIGRELRERYGSDYRVVCASWAEAGLRKLRELKEAGEDVAIVLADQWMPGMSGTDFLTRVREIYPTAKRVLLIAWGDRTASGAILQAMSLGQMDYYVNKPWGSLDERFHRIVGEFLYDWAKDRLPKFE